MSLGSYKLYEAFSPSNVSKQEFFDGTPTITIIASTTRSLSVALPECESQYDLWYGDVVHVQQDNHSYGEFLSGDQVRLDQFCLHTIVPPIQVPIHIIKHVINDSGGTSTASLFIIHVKSASIDIVGSPAPGIESPGTLYTVATGTYVVSEEMKSGYLSSFSGNCDASGVITVTSNTEQTCTITNNDIATTTPVIVTVIPPITPVSSGGGCIFGCTTPRIPNPPTYHIYVPPPVALIAYVPPPVFTPSFPDAGFGPEPTKIPWLAFTFMGILFLATSLVGRYSYASNKK